MKLILVFSFLILLSLYSCGRQANHTDRKVSGLTHTDSKVSAPTHTKSSAKLIPILGYRFRITGDFDGDGKKEILTEHFISGIDHKETYKFYENGDYDTLVSLNHGKKPISFLSCNRKGIDDYMIDSGGSSLGLAYLKNEGDLDGDGADEISYVVDWADWSNVNDCNIMTYKDHKWKELYSFEIRDWQLPDLPQTYNQYGLFGLENKIVNEEDTAANKIIEKNLKDFRGLIKKIADNKIRITNMSIDAEKDTRVVDLRKHHHRE